MAKARKARAPVLPDKLPERKADAAAPRMRSVEEIVADQRRNAALCRRLFAKPDKRAKA